jgi:hypothetical protein
VCGIEKLQAAKFHEGNIATRQLDLERPAVRGSAEENRLLLEESSFLAVSKDALDDVPGLVGLVAHGDEARLCRRRALRPEVLGKAFPCEINDAVCGA